jgi:hypothetical protein
MGMRAAENGQPFAAKNQFRLPGSERGGNLGAVFGPFGRVFDSDVTDDVIHGGVRDGSRGAMIGAVRAV